MNPGRCSLPEIMLVILSCVVNNKILIDSLSKTLWSVPDALIVKCESWQKKISSLDLTCESVTTKLHVFDVGYQTVNSDREPLGLISNNLVYVCSLWFNVNFKRGALLPQSRATPRTTRIIVLTWFWSEWISGFTETRLIENSTSFASKMTMWMYYFCEGFVVKWCSRNL